MARGNGKTEKDLLLNLISDVRELQGSQGGMKGAVGDMQRAMVEMQHSMVEMQHSMTAMQRAQAQAAATTQKMIGTLEALVETAGRQDAEIDDLRRRVEKLERR